MKIFIAGSSLCRVEIKNFASLLSSPLLGNHEITTCFNDSATNFQKIADADKVVIMRKNDIIQGTISRLEVSYCIAFAKYIGKEVVYFDVTDGANLVLGYLNYLLGLEKEKKNGED